MPNYEGLSGNTVNRNITISRGLQGLMTLKLLFKKFTGKQSRKAYAIITANRSKILPTTLS